MKSINNNITATMNGVILAVLSAPHDIGREISEGVNHGANGRWLGLSRPILEELEAVTGIQYTDLPGGQE